MAEQKFKSVSTRLVLYIAWQNIVTRKLRSALTAGGIVIGIGSIFFLLSLGYGLQNLVTQQVVGNQSVKTIDVTTPNSDIVRLNNDNLTKLSQLANVTKAGGLFASPGKINYEQSEVDSVIYGAQAGFQAIARIPLVAGKFVEPSDTQKVVVNTATLKAMGVTDHKSALGKQLRLSLDIEAGDQVVTNQATNYTVIGVAETGSGSEVYVSDSVFIAAQATSYKQAKLLVSSSESVATVRKQAESLGFETSSPLDTIAQIQQLFRYLNAILVGIGSIGMLVAILGMFNTLTISLLERTREIGLMIALGLRNQDIGRLFVTESLLLSAIGSVVGIGLALIAGLVINLVMNSIASSRGFNEAFSVFAAPWWLPILTTGFMLLVGLAVAFFPARRASRINPIDALHDE